MKLIITKPIHHWERGLGGILLQPGEYPVSDAELALNHIDGVRAYIVKDDGTTIPNVVMLQQDLGSYYGREPRI